MTTALAKPKTLIEKLAFVMGEIDHVEKRGFNKFHNYAYMKATDLANAVRVKLAEQKVVMLSDIVEVRNYEIPAKEGTQQAVDLKVRYTFYDGESDATVSFCGHGTGTDKGDKATYKANTGALKYALRNAFLVPDESDPEADESTDKNTDKAKGKKPAADGAETISGIVRLQETDKNGEGREYYRFQIGEKQVCAFFDSDVVSRLIDQQKKYVVVEATPQGNVWALTKVVSINKAAPEGVEPKATVKKPEPAPKSDPPKPTEEPSPILDGANLPAGQDGVICTFKKYTAMKTKAAPGKPPKPYIILEIEDSTGRAGKLFVWNTKMTDAVTKSINKRCDVAFSSKPHGEDTLFTLEGFMSIDGVPTDMYGKPVLTPEHITDADIPDGEVA